MYKVLIVDDEPIVKIALRSIINWEDYGYTICATASDGKEALELTSSLSPNLIITDLKMPRMDGLSLIQGLKDQCFAGEIMVISNYEDFNSVRSALVMGAADYLLKVSIERDSLIKHLEMISKRLDQSHDHDLIAQTLKKDQEKQLHDEYLHQLKNYLEIADYPLSPLEESMSAEKTPEVLCYHLCYLNFNQMDTIKEKNYSKQLVYNTLEETLREIPRKDILFLDYHAILILLYEEAVSETTYSIPAIATKLSTAFGLYLSLSPTVLYEESIHGLESLKKSYEAFLEELCLNFYEPLGVIAARTYTPIHYMNFIYYKEYAQTVHKNNTRFLEKSLSSAKEIIDSCQKLHVYPEIIKKFFEKTLELIEYMNPSHSIETHDYLADQKDFIRNCKSAEQLYQLIHDSFETIYAPAPALSNQGIINYKQEIKRALEYINHNYQQRISLTGIADEVGLSPSYLSRLFKSETGMSISNYINQLRMEKAGAILRDSRSDPYMKEIALLIGIDDQLYFSRLFKKYFNMTPSEYRSKYHGEPM